MKKRRILCLLSVLALSVSLLSSCGGGNSAAPQTSSAPAETAPVQTAEPAAETRTVTDLAGRTVTLDADVERVATLMGPAFEKVFMLGAADRIVLNNKAFKNNVWANRLYPNIQNIPTAEQANEPNVEELISLGVQTVFFWSYPDPLESMEAAGIPVVVCMSPEVADTVDAFKQNMKDGIMVYANALGGDAALKGQAWCDYFEETIRFVQERTASLPEEERHTKVYYGSSADGFECFTNGSTVMFYLDILGADLVSRDLPGTFEIVTMEQIVAWDPEVIFTGRMTSADVVLQDDRWSSLTAVKNGAVVTTPLGVSAIDNSTESPLLLLFMAKTLHPALFEDVDMLSEIKDYYHTFYAYELSDAEAESILYQLPLEG